MNPPVLEMPKVMPVVTSVRPKAGGSLKLNLGGRDKPIEGFLTVDLCGGEGVDVHCDCARLICVKDNTVDEIYASQILEHFPHNETENVLKEWHRVLKPHAKITIGVPDFARAIDLYLKMGLTEWVMNFLYGDQIYPLAFHYRPFTFATLAALLNKSGFSQVKRLTKMPYGIRDCSALVSTEDGKSVSLNVEAWK